MNEKAKESLNKAGNICLFVKENCNDEQTARYMSDAIEAINEAVKCHEAEKLELKKESESWHGIAHCFAIHDAVTDERLDKLMKSRSGNVAKMRDVLEWATSTMDVSPEVLDETEDWENEVVCWVLELQKKARAALEAQSETPSDVAKMRDALERCNELFRCDDDNKSRLCHLARKADEATQAALATEKGDTE